MSPYITSRIIIVRFSKETGQKNLVGIKGIVGYSCARIESLGFCSHNGPFSTIWAGDKVSAEMSDTISLPY